MQAVTNKIKMKQMNLNLCLIGSMIIQKRLIVGFLNYSKITELS